MSGFTHFDDQGDAVMVDVSDKDVTTREADLEDVFVQLTTQAREAA